MARKKDIPIGEISKSISRDKRHRSAIVGEREATKRSLKRTLRKFRNL